MKSRLFWIAAMLLTMTVIAPVHAQCSGGFCRGPATNVAEYRWQTREDDPNRRYLYFGDVCVGGYDLVEDCWRPYDAQTGQWGPCAVPPWGAAPAAAQAEKPSANFGVDTSKLSGPEKYTLHTQTGARQLTREAAHDLVGAALQDDSGKLRVTIIGPDDKQKIVAADLARLGGDLPGWAVVRHYGADHWSVQPGFVKTGSPTIYCQAPGGKVLHRQDDYDGGGEALVQALRKAKASYDSKKDPDLRNGASDAELPPVAAYGLAALLGAGVSHFLQRRKAGEA